MAASGFKKKVVAFLPALLWACAIAVLSTVSGFRLPDVAVVALAPDKLAHFSVYAIWALLLFWGFSRGNMRAMLNLRVSFAIILGGFLYGVAMEWMQAKWFPDRSFELADMIANGAGFISGWIASPFFIK